MWNKIYNVDVIDGLERLKNKGVKFDLIITSPPYNIKDFHSNHIRYANYKGNNMNETIYQEWQLEILNLLYELLEDHGSIFYNHKNRISKGEMITPYEWILKSPLTLKQEITWNQNKGANVAKIRCFPFSEKIFWLAKNPKVKMHNKLNLKDVWTYTPKLTRKQSMHPAVMPLEIVENIYTITEDVMPDTIKVLDPFAGIGSTFIPIETDNKYKFIGLEIENKYIEVWEDDLNNRKESYRR